MDLTTMDGREKKVGQKMSLTFSANQLYYKGNQQGGEQWLT